MRPDRLQLTFGRVVRRERLARGLSQEQLAHLAGMTRNGVTYVELGKRAPSINVIASLAAGLGVRASDLLRAAEEEDG